MVVGNVLAGGRPVLIVILAGGFTTNCVWCLALKEWKGTSRRPMALLAGGLALLVISTIISGYGNSLAGAAGGH